MFRKLLTWIKMFFAYRAGEKAQKTVDQTTAVAAANTIGQRIEHAQTDVEVGNGAGVAKWLRDQGGL